MNNLAIKRIEVAFAVLLTGMAVVFLVIRMTHAGALWRDECASVQLAQDYTPAGIFDNFAREAFPPPYFFGLRAYASIFGGSDASFRALGALIGGFMLLAIWTSSRTLGDGPPLILLSLLGLNPTFLTWGTTVRGYGLGSVLVLLAFALVAGLFRDCSRTRITVAGCIALLSVQVLIYNSVLIPAIGAAAIVVAILRRNFRLAMVIAGIVALCGVSMLPYLGAYLRATQWNMLQKGPLTMALIWKQLALAFGGPSLVMGWIWPALFIVTIALAVSRGYRTRQNNPTRESDLLAFAVACAIFSNIGYYAFLKTLSYGTRPWYYLALVTVLAGIIELCAAVLSSLRWARHARLVTAALALLLFPWLNWPALIERQTNVDLIAQKLTKIARSNDLIVANPWWLGISFNRYYHGATSWTTLPTMPDHLIHRFDLVKAKMESESAVDDLRDQIRQTLRGGNRVWFIGGINLPQPGEPPPRLPDASDIDFRWNSDLYCDFWSSQVGEFVQAHFSGIAVIPEPATGPVNALEDAPLIGVEGWKE